MIYHAQAIQKIANALIIAVIASISRVKKPYFVALIKANHVPILELMIANLGNALAIPIKRTRAIARTSQTHRVDHSEPPDGSIWPTKRLNLYLVSRESQPRRSATGNPP